MIDKKMFLLVISVCAIIGLLMGPVSAASLNVTDTGLAATGVKNYTATTGHLPGYVDVSDKNSTIASFLNTLTTYTVELNQSVTTPVTIATVTAAPSPSGSANGTLQKSEYVSVASSIESYINSNGRAPNYASSSLGNIRYESLVYMYSNILSYYQTNHQLPSSVVVSNIAGVDSTGVVIDNMPPTIANNVASGTYNTLKNVTLTATDDFDPNPVVYYSTNNGTTWNHQTKTITLALTQGKTNLSYYGCDASGNIGTTQSANYTIDTTAPTVTASPLGGIYNVTQLVTLTANDNLDPNPTIYYTLNGTTPTTSSTKYTNQISIFTPITTILKYIAVDAAGNQAAVQTQNYTLNLVSNINTGKTYSRIQDAINDPLTLNGNIIQVQSGTYLENLIVNKTLTIMPVSGANVILQALNSSNNVITINSTGAGSIIQGLTIKGATGTNTYGILINSANNCNLIGNIITNNWRGLDIVSSNNCTVSGNTVKNSTDDGLRLDFTNNTLVSNNNETSNGWNGILLAYANNNIVTGNIATGNSAEGIYLGYASNNIVSDNTMTNNADNGIYPYYSNNTSIIGNTITSNSAEGILQEHSNSTTMQNNIITNNIDSGIDNHCSYNILAQNNTISHNYWGIYSDQSSNGNITGNNVSNNSYDGIWLTNSNNTTIQTNNITNNYYGIYLIYSNSTIITENTITNSTYGINPQYSTATIQFNRITGCTSWGLVNQDNSTVTATNNWWGTNYSGSINYCSK